MSIEKETVTSIWEFTEGHLTYFVDQWFSLDFMKLYSRLPFLDTKKCVMSFPRIVIWMMSEKRQYNYISYTGGKLKVRIKYERDYVLKDYLKIYLCEWGWSWGLFIFRLTEEWRYTDLF